MSDYKFLAEMLVILLPVLYIAGYFLLKNLLEWKSIAREWKQLNDELVNKLGDIEDEKDED